MVEFSLDPEYLEEAVNKAAEFYNCMVDVIEPPHSEKDLVQIVDDEFEKAAREWKAAKEMYDFHEAKEKYLRSVLLSLTDDGNCCGYGITIRRIAREGNIDWTRLWEDISKDSNEIAMKFNPDEYRNEQIGYWKITNDKR